MRQRVVLVRVTLGASPSHPHPRLASGGNAILDRGDTVFLVVRSAFGVVHGVAMEAGGDEFFVRGLAEQVPGELENGEPVERHVLVQSFDDPVAIRPDGPEGVLFVAHGIRVPGKVKPHSRPTLAEGAGIQQSIHQGSVSIGRSVGYERIYRFGSRRETGQVKRESPDERVSIRLVRWAQTGRFDACQYEAVDRIPDPGRARYGRRCRPARRLERPVAVELRPGIDPPAQDPDFVSREALSRGRHGIRFGGDARNDSAGSAVARDQSDVSSRLPCRGFVRVEPQVRHAAVLVRTVARQAFLQDRANLSLEVGILACCETQCGCKCSKDCCPRSRIGENPCNVDTLAIHRIASSVALPALRILVASVGISHVRIYDRDA